MIFVEEVNMIVQSPLFKHCREADQVTDRQRMTWSSPPGPEKRELSDALDYKPAKVYKPQTKPAAGTQT